MSYPSYVRERALRLVIDEGWSVAAAAEECGVSAPTVYEWVRKGRTELGFPAKRVARSSEEERAVVVDLVVSGQMTFAQAARAFHRSYTTVHGWVSAAVGPDGVRAIRMAAKDEAIRLMLGEGLGVTAVARRLGLLVDTVSRWRTAALAERGLARPLPSGAHPAEVRDEAVRLVTDERLPCAEVSRRLGVPEGTIYSWVHRGRDRGRV